MNGKMTGGLISLLVTDRWTYLMDGSMDIWLITSLTGRMTGTMNSDMAGWLADCRQ